MEIYKESLVNMCKNILFGIEIETCYHNVKKSDNTRLSNDNNKYKKSLVDNRNNIFLCFEAKSKKYNIPSLKWVYCHPQEENCGGYKNWIVTSDPTVYCQSTVLTDELYSMSSLNGGNGKSINIPKVEFYPVELVSPILNMNTNYTESGEGFAIISYIYFGWLMDRNLIYTINDSQGLHVNVSNPNMNIDEYTGKFIKMLYIMEPIILNMITEDRRNLVDNTLRETSFDDIDIESLYKKHSIVKIHKDRLEIRIFDGTMVYDEIYFTTLFCVLLLGASILATHDKLDSLLHITNIHELFKQLESFIGDNKTINYVIDMYNKNKMDDSPHIDKYTNNIDLFPKFYFNKDHKNKLLPAMSTHC